MPEFTSISHLDDPRLAPYRNQKDAWLRASHHPEAAADSTPTGLAGGRFLAEGELVFEQLTTSRFEIESVLLATSRVEDLRTHLERLRPQTPVFHGPAALLEAIVGYAMHRGVLACALRGPEPQLHEVLATAQTVVLLEDLANHDNVGGIARCLRGLGGPTPAMLLTPRCCDPLYRRALRVSIGHALHIPFARVDWPRDLDLLRSSGFTTIALSPEPGLMPIHEVPALTRVCLLAGTEGPGLSKHAMDRADLRVRIPLHPAVDSLNVSVAVAIALHALQRNSAGIGNARASEPVRIH
jgi:tRNA G18 (ribose-2'-O)-methylase SpoU